MKFFRRDDGQRHDSFDSKDLQLFDEKLRLEQLFIDKALRQLKKSRGVSFS